jgi:alginate O-acetyltransferase complex protein AlgI
LLNNLAVGVRRVVIGLGKIILIANTVAVAAGRVFAMRAAEISAAHAWLGVV